MIQTNRLSYGSKTFQHNYNLSGIMFGGKHLGLKRRTNEDDFLVTNFDEVIDENTGSEKILQFVSNVNSFGCLMAVADGVSGESGAWASRSVVQNLADLLKRPTIIDPLKRLVTAVETLNRRIFERATRQNLRNMATTLTAVYINQDTAHIAHVGNSRALLIRGTEIRQLTKDQTLAEHLRSYGQNAFQKISPAAEKVLLQAIGNNLLVEVQSATVQLQPEDVILVCSDGLTNKLSPAEIRNIVLEFASVELAAQKLIDLANERGGEDNITVVLARIGADLQENSFASMQMPKATFTEMYA